MKKHGHLFSRMWEELLIAAIGEVFEESDVVGVVLRLRKGEDSLALWNKDQTLRYRIGEKLKKILQLPANCPGMEYQTNYFNMNFDQGRNHPNESKEKETTSNGKVNAKGNGTVPSNPVNNNNNNSNANVNRSNPNVNNSDANANTNKRNPNVNNNNANVNNSVNNSNANVNTNSNANVNGNNNSHANVVNNHSNASNTTTVTVPINSKASNIKTPTKS
eukprot:TRINITY_DN1253_c0_g1_i4.p1 TRINITY_DN1253_c0_g1~~TRINITY_DN1253_c0_g1_i4.p1  ORF type:complete len:219 (+),score=62.39 TRINITY_DN1253_c0_g1_i4:746-1402(+)